ncbi:MAG: hypothetical protein JWP18_1584 [Solirubrobacterales bacterium]|jgi:hypothetical protein|nr:hypothetical protein [Solirubrobacterales bacterium]
MSTVSAKIGVPYPISDAEALWYDTGRWAGFVDGFHTVESIEGDWPRAGARVVWATSPGGRGRVVETVAGYEPRVSCATTVRDDQLDGTQTISFAPHDQGTMVRLELTYDIRERTLVTPLVDLFFVKRTQRDSLQRTLRRFALELRDDHDPPL